MFSFNFNLSTFHSYKRVMTVFLNRAVILLLTFSFSLDLEKKSSLLLLLTSVLKTLYLFSFSL